MRLTIAALVVLFVACVLSPLNAQDESEMLRGLPGVYVVVGDIDPEIARGGLTKAAVKTRVDLRLRTHGIPVLTEDEWNETDTFPHLAIGLAAFYHEDALVIYTLDVNMYEYVTLDRNTDIGGYVATWETGEVGVELPSDLMDILDSIDGLVDQFANDYLAVNQRRVWPIL